MLAAGMSCRLGQPKQLLRVRSEPLVRWQLRKLLASDYHPVGVVVGAESGRVMQVLKGLPVQFIHNPDYMQGIGTSVATAARWVKQLRPMPAALLLTVCDQLFLSTHLLDQMRARWLEVQPQAIVCRYTVGKGVPALFAASCFDDLAKCDGAQGAKQVWNKLSHVIEMSFPKGQIDLDQPEDLHWLDQLP